MVDRQGCEGMFLSIMAESTFPTDLTLEGSIFQRVVAATEKALVPILVLTLGTKRKSELDYRS